MPAPLLSRDYQILRGQSIGEGGTSNVVLTHKVGQDQTMVAKIMDMRLPHSLLAYQNECSILDHLKGSPNIIRKEGDGLLRTNGEEAAILLERMDYDLLTLMLDYELTEEERWSAFLQICLAVQSCHRRNVAHLDLKPENVLCSNRVETVKLSDFGASKRLPASGMISRVVGTELYAAPEVVLPNTNLVDGRKADIWSLGVLFHTLFTGTWPFVASSQEDLRRQVSQGQVTLSKSLSRSERLFLSPLLLHDPRMRPSIEEIMASFPLHHTSNITITASATPRLFQRLKRVFQRASSRDDK